jgi:hypothetical protein
MRCRSLVSRATSLRQRRGPFGALRMRVFIEFTLRKVSAAISRFVLPRVMSPMIS